MSREIVRKKSKEEVMQELGLEVDSSFENERRLDRATVEFLEGEIDLEEYREIADKVPGIDFRAMASWQMRRDAQIKVNNAKEKVLSLISSIKEILD